MARLPRLAAAGELHHLLLRGHNGQAVFADDADRLAFVNMLREAAAAQAVAIHAYALLDDEVHLLVTPAQADALGRLMQSLGRRYVGAFNRRHGRRGTLWDGRFKTSLLDAQTLLFDATVAIETLVLRAGRVGAAQDWPWSSAAHHVGQRRDPLVTDHPLYWQLGNTPFDRESAHTHALQEGISGLRSAAVMTAVARGQVLGPPDFVARMAAELDRPALPAVRGRPRRVERSKTVPN